jgi:hypothetical protein
VTENARALTAMSAKLTVFARRNAEFCGFPQYFGTSVKNRSISSPQFASIRGWLSKSKQNRTIHDVVKEILA